MPRELFSNCFVNASVDDSRRIALFTRSDRPFTHLEELHDAYGALVRISASLDRKSLGLLIDLRDAPARNDPAFEQAMSKYRGPMMQGYQRVALLVKTVTGKLQVSRHALEDRTAVLVTQDATEASAFLTGRQPKK